MTTLTIDEPSDLEKTHFKNVSELYIFLSKTFEKKSEKNDEINSFEDLDFRELRDDEITDKMKKEIDEIRSMKESEFINI